MRLSGVLFTFGFLLIATVDAIGGAWLVAGQTAITAFYCCLYYIEEFAKRDAYQKGYNRALIDAHQAISRSICHGILQGDGFDQVAERNGLVMAKNLVTSLLGDAR